MQQTSIDLKCKTKSRILDRQYIITVLRVQIVLQTKQDLVLALTTLHKLRIEKCISLLTKLFTDQN